MEKPDLFSSTKEFFLFSVVCSFLIVLHLWIRYGEYKAFIVKPFYYTQVEVLSAYMKTKNHRRYQVLKVHSTQGHTFYTTTHHEHSMLHKRLRLQLFPDKKIGFLDYLGTFYVKSKIKEVYPKEEERKDRLFSFLFSQHHTEALKHFYGAIFFATPLTQELREKISLLGVSHLVALSGFHLGILWGLVYGILGLLYRLLQQRYFPYRYALFDVGLVVILLLGIYVWFVGSPPSLLRSYAMMLLGWMVLLLGVKLLSFTFLSMVGLLLLVLFPSLLVSLSFWFSMAGVFYIFLLLRYFQSQHSWLISLLVLPLGIFVLMLPVVHGVFGVTSPFQLLSPLLSLLFILFYPFEMLLHLLGWGGLLDGWLLWLFALPKEGVVSLLSSWMVVVYVGLSLGAIWKKSLFYLLCGVALAYALYLFIFV